MPSWFDVTPRFGVAYDLFGNAKTALKGSVNKYMAGQTLGFAQRYNPFSVADATRGPGPICNGDDIAQDNEIGREQRRALRPAGPDAAPGATTSRASTTGSTAPASSTS